MLRRSLRVNLARLPAGVTAAMTLFIGLQLLSTLHWFQCGVIAGVWGVFFILGANLRILIAMKTSKRLNAYGPSWSGAFWLSLSSAIAATALMDVEGLTAFPFLSALAINIAYVGIKLGCGINGCCPASVIYSRYFSIKLAYIEAIVSATTVASMTVLFFYSGNFLFSALLGYIGHAVLRFVANLARYPNRSVTKQLIDKGGPLGGVIYSCISISIIPVH